MGIAGTSLGRPDVSGLGDPFSEHRRIGLGRTVSEATKIYRMNALSGQNQQGEGARRRALTVEELNQGQWADESQAGPQGGARHGGLAESVARAMAQPQPAPHAPQAPQAPQPQALSCLIYNN